MTPLRRWWATAFLATVGLIGMFLLLAFFTSTLSPAIGNWLPLLMCLGSILSIGIVVITVIGFVIESPKPQFDSTFWEDVSLPWAFAGGFVGLCLLLLQWGVASCCYPDAATYINRFGVIFFCIGFAFGAVLEKGVLLLFAGFSLRYIGFYLSPIFGDVFADILLIIGVIGMVGVAMYWRYQDEISGKRRGKVYMAYPDDDSLKKLQHWPLDGKEWLLKHPPPWLAAELAQPGLTKDWLADGPASSRSRHSFGWSLGALPQAAPKTEQDEFSPFACLTLLLAGVGIFTGLVLLLRRRR